MQIQQKANAGVNTQSNEKKRNKKYFKKSCESITDCVYRLSCIIWIHIHALVYIQYTYLYICVFLIFSRAALRPLYEFRVRHTNIDTRNLF